jgi:hypothetical protein
MRSCQPLLTFVCFFLCLSSLRSQEESRPIMLGAKDSLLLIVQDGKKIILHTIKPKQTLFSLSKFYSLTLEELYDFNPQFRTDPTVHVGAKVKIPIPNRAIKRYKTKGFVKSQNTPIYYLVQPGDNMYQICKRYFDMPVDSIVKRNRLKDKRITPGQLILMGWMGVEGIPLEWRPARTFAESGALKTRYDDEKKKLKEVVSQGVCFWQKDSKEKGSLYALHRDAAIGTIIAVTNPMYDHTIYAKVIGRIPEGYERNVEVVLSPEAARKIGARDPRFFVKVKYLK